jgi:hypothetical protein
MDKRIPLKCFTQFSMPFECSDMEGRELLAIPDLNIRSARH